MLTKRGRQRFSLKRCKRGVFFSTDALIALTIIFFVMLILYPVFNLKRNDSDVHYDVMNMISSLEVGELNNVYVSGLISSGVINDTNNSLLEQIGEFYVVDRDLARSFASNVFSGLDFGNDNFGIWYGSSLIYSYNSTPFETSESVETTRKIISGLEAGEGVTGFSARAMLGRSLRQDYFYLGGFVGQGNLSLLVSYVGNISSAEMEIAINDDFDLYVNGVNVGDYNKSDSEFIPARYLIPINEFSSGDNLVELRGDNLYVAGGFVKITYDSDAQYQQPSRYYFPGIEGVVNLYDGFYVPGELGEMKINLSLKSEDANIFLTVGNETLFNRTTSGLEEVVIENSVLDSLFYYSELSEKTIPLRLGLENVSYEGIVQDIDVISVSDLSGSMCDCSGGNFWCCAGYVWSGGCQYHQPNCESCGGSCTAGIYELRDANNLFIDIILGNDGNRVGLVGYASDVERFHPLSDNEDSLKLEVDSWVAVGGTCICCGINKAVEELVSGSSAEKFRSIVVMSDGEANRQCSQQGTGDAKEDAIQAACDAYADGIIVNAIAFGDEADVATLTQLSAGCGGGAFVNADPDDLAGAYEQIADHIVAMYAEQVLEVSGEIDTFLSEESYIEFEYQKTPALFGLYLTMEKSFDSVYGGSFYVPADADVLDVGVVSYSGPRWTDYVSVNGEEVYRLSDFGTDYLSLGDPYIVNVPVSLVNNGSTNYVNLTTGVSPTNSSGGSTSNKIIYTLRRGASAFSGIVGSAEGCNWSIQFEDGSVLNTMVPPGYTGTDNCYYNETSFEEVGYGHDAYQVAVFSLLKDLDLDGNGKVDVVFTSQGLDVSVDTLTGIPYHYLLEVQARTWR
jgi:hypothetical protein